MQSESEDFRRAVAFHKVGDFDKAHEFYSQTLLSNNKHAAALFGLAVISNELRETEKSREYAQRAIEADSAQPGYYLFMAQLEEDAGRIDAAIGYLNEAIKLAPGFARAHNTLGILYQKRGNMDGALNCFRTAVKVDSSNAVACNNLGNLLSAMGRHEEAIEWFRRAVEIKPDYFLAYANLGETLFSIGQYAAARGAFGKASELKPDSFHAHYGQGCVLKMERQFARAETCFRAALARQPGQISALVNLAYVLFEQDKIEDAIGIYQRILTLDEANLAASLGSELALPHVYQNDAEVMACRERYSQGLKHLSENIGRFMEKPQHELLADLVQWGNFLLPYQGQNDRQLQEEYGSFLGRLLKNAFPDLFQISIPAATAGTGRKLRIGYLGSFFRHCTVGSYFQSWITGIDREKFEIVVYSTGGRQDEFSGRIAASCDRFKRFVGKGIADIARQVREDSIDILVFPEVGMDTSTAILANFRLAPVQCAAWGHPVTTGFSNIDYFFSSELMEPEQAAAHYCEKLVMLPGIGTCYVKPDIKKNDRRSDFQLPEGKNIYLCPQSFFKIHPDNDALLVEILERDANGVLVLFQDPEDAINQKFIQRLSRAFDERQLDKSGRVKMLPRVSHEDYLKINQVCDVMLDTLYWSGGNTALDALASGLPIVTLPGAMMRGRQSYGMLTAMGLDELIARDTGDYVDIALRLANDKEWRRQMSEKISSRSDRVFGDSTPLRALERFYRQVGVAA